MSKTPIRLYSDNMSANYNVQNHVFHKKTKHIEVDSMWYGESMMLVFIIESKHASSTTQLANLLTKPLWRYRVQFICNNLSMYDVYAPA